MSAPVIKVSNFLGPQKSKATLLTFEVTASSKYTKNLFTGEVLTVAEGEKHLIENLFDLLKVGPSYSDVRSANIIWQKNKNEFN